MNAVLALVATPLGLAVYKGTVVVAMALSLSRLLATRLSAAWRHAIIMASLATFALVVSTAIVIPEMRWRVLPRIEKASESSTWNDTGHGTVATTRNELNAAASGPASRAVPETFKLADLFIVAWVAGAALLFARVFAIVIATAMRRRRSVQLSDRNWLNLLHDCQRSIDISRRVELLLAEEESSPFLWGIHRPAIVLPPSATGWTSARQRFVLLHELAHLQRRDVDLAFATQLIVALFWWNPILWLASREAEETREMAADDAALRTGVDASAYVIEIVELVRFSRRAALYPAFSGGGSMRFERRMMRALAPRPVRGRVGVRGAALLSACAILAGCAVAGLTTREASLTLGMTGCAYDGGRHLDVGRKLPDGRAVWIIEWSGQACRVRAEFIGSATYDIAARSITLPGVADSFRLAIEHGAQSDSLIVAAGRAGAQAISTSARAKVDLSQVVSELESHTGFGASVRVPGLLREGGYAAVLVAARSMQVDHAVGRYLTEALRLQAPTLDDVHQVLAVAAERVTNEYQLVALLNAAAPHRVLDNASAQSAYQRAVATLQTTAGRRSVLASLESHHPRTR